MGPDRPIQTVTFDCWSTLIYEPDPTRNFGLRVAAYRDLLLDAGVPRNATTVEESLNAAWTRHYEYWASGRIAGAAEVARWSLEHLEIPVEPLLARLVRTLQETQLVHGVQVLAGARDGLQRLRAAGIRRGLICDTGLTPGHVVRKLLAQVGLLEELEVLIFSDEAGVPKPDPRVFEAALRALGTPASASVHVGDLRRTDVAGARGVGMTSVRIREHHDDRSDFPEADVVVDGHAELLEWILAPR